MPIADYVVAQKGDNAWLYRGYVIVRQAEALKPAMRTRFSFTLEASNNSEIWYSDSFSACISKINRLLDSVEDDSVDWENDPKAHLKVATGNSQLSQPIYPTFHIVSTLEEYRIVQGTTQEVAFLYSIIASFYTETRAAEALDKAKTVERQLRPMWQAAIEHERRLRHLMHEAVTKAAIGEKF